MKMKNNRMKSLQIILLIILQHSLCIQSFGQKLRFEEPVDIGAESVSGVTALDAGDFNLDGLMDVAVLEGGKHAEKPTFAWFEQQANGKWKRHEFGNNNLIDSFLGSAKCADMDGDGDYDLVFTSDNHSVGPIKVFIFVNPGNPAVYESWKPYHIATIQGYHANDMKIADMNNDGKKEVIIRHKDPNTIEILFQPEKFYYEEWKVKSLPTGKLGTEGFAIGNINEDLLPDISVNGYWFKAPSDPENASYTLFSIDTLYTQINPNTKEEIGDINGDGLNDIVISPAEAYGNGKDHILAWYEAPKNPENSAKWIKHIIKEPYNNAHTVKLIDIDNDGDLDIISGQAWPPKQITVFLNNQGDFSKSFVITEDKGIYSGAILDMDGDGDIDIVGEDTYANKAKPWYYKNLLKSTNNAKNYE